MFSLSVSIILIVIFLLAVPTGVMSDACFRGGEIISCLLRSLNLTYSSNSNFIFLDLKLIASYFGVAVTITGEILSFGPPSGLPFLAQLVVNEMNKIKNKQKENSFFKVKLVLF